MQNYCLNWLKSYFSSILKADLTAYALKVFGLRESLTSLPQNSAGIVRVHQSFKLQRYTSSNSRFAARVCNITLKRALAVNDKLDLDLVISKTWSPKLYTLLFLILARIPLKSLWFITQKLYCNRRMISTDQQKDEKNKKQTNWVQVIDGQTNR